MHRSVYKTIHTTKNVTILRKKHSITTYLFLQGGTHLNDAFNTHFLCIYFASWVLLFSFWFIIVIDQFIQCKQNRQFLKSFHFFAFFEYFNWNIKILSIWIRRFWGNLTASITCQLYTHTICTARLQFLLRFYGWLLCFQRCICTGSN